MARARRWQILPATRRALGRAVGDESKALADRVRSSSVTTVTPGVPYSDNWDLQRAVEEGYEGNPLVFRAISVITDQAMARKIVLFENGDEDTGDKIVDPGADPTRLLYCLNKRANPWETGRIFRNRLIAQYLMSKKGVFLEVVRTRANRIGMLNIVDPNLVNFVPSEQDPMNAFEVRTPNGSSDFLNYLPRFDPNASPEQQPVSMLWVRCPHPLVMWQGVTPMKAAGLSIDLDRYARLYNRRFLQNDGRPGGLLSIRGTVSRDQMELIQAQFMGGPESAGRTTVISADAVSYADTSGSPRDLMWGELSKLTKEEICTTFGVPMSILFGASGETFDNADADYAMFWEFRMKPLLMLLDDQLDILTGGYDDQYLFRHDLSDVWVLGRHKREAADRAAADLERGALSYDDYREAIGEDRLNVPATSVLWIPPGKMAVSSNPDSGEAEQAVSVPLASPMGATALPGQQTPGQPQGETPGGAPRQLPPGASTQGGPNQDETTTLRVVQGTQRGVADEGADLERADALGGQRQELEGKQGGPRSGAAGGRDARAGGWR